MASMAKSRKTQKNMVAFVVGNIAKPLGMRLAILDGGLRPYYNEKNGRGAMMKHDAYDIHD